MNNAAWTKAGSTVSGTLYTAPDGTTTANRVTITSQYTAIFNQISATSGVTYTDTIWVQSVSGNTNIHLILSQTGAYLQVTPITITGTWTRFTYTVSNWNSAYSVQVGLQDRNASGFPTVINVWGAQLELGSVALSLIHI